MSAVSEEANGCQGRVVLAALAVLAIRRSRAPSAAVAESGRDVHVFGPPQQQRIGVAQDSTCNCEARALTRLCFTYVAVICDKSQIQPLLPQFLISNGR